MNLLHVLILYSVRHAGAGAPQLTTHNLPALTDLAISHTNTIIVHDQDHPLHCHFTEVPLVKYAENPGQEGPISAKLCPGQAILIIKNLKSSVEILFLPAPQWDESKIHNVSTCFIQHTDV